MNDTNDFFRQILDQVNNGVYFVDKDRRITYWNKGAEEITGYASQEVIGTACYENILVHSDAEGNILCHSGCPLQDCMVDGEKREAEIFLKDRTGVRVPISIYAVPLHDENGDVSGAVEVFEDLRPVRNLEKTIEELSNDAYMDKLSGALNRRSIESLLQSRWRQFMQGGQNMGLIFTDMDQLKLINDEFGHMAGDHAIMHLAETLKNATRDSDIVGRWGGDEFIVVAEVDNQERLSGVLAKLVALLNSSPAMYKEQRIAVRASFGGALFSEANSLQELLELTDQRMYAYKG